MAQQHFNRGNSFSNSKNKGNYKPKPPKKTTAELAKEVVDTYFKGLENDLLSLNDVSKIKSIFFHLENFAEKMSPGLTASQLRNVYGKILKAKTHIDLQLLRPNLAYVAARNKSKEAKQMMAFIDYLIQKVDDPEKQKSFNKLLESVVAYHKYYYQTKEEEQ